MKRSWKKEGRPEEMKKRTKEKRLETGQGNTWCTFIVITPVILENEVPQTSKESSRFESPNLVQAVAQFEIYLGFSNIPHEGVVAYL